MSLDPQAERTLALTLVSSPSAYDYCGEVIEREMFTDALAGQIYSAVQALLFRGLPVSAVAVQAELLESGVAKTAIPSWSRGVTVPPNETASLANRIRECWAQREVVALGQRVGEISLQRGSQAALNAIAEIQAKLQSKPTAKAKSMLQVSHDLVSELTEQLSGGGKVTFDTGYELLDKYTNGLRVGELFVIGARPSQGKSSFVMGMMAYLARTGVNVGAFWLEDDWRDAGRRYHQARHYVPAMELRGSPQMALRRLNDVVVRNVEEQERIFIDDTHGLSATDIAARMRRMAREDGVKVFFADHLGEFGISQGDSWGDRHDLALGKAARIYRDTAKDLGCVPVLCSQMNRRVEQRAGQEPVLSDLDGSGQLEQAARVVAFISTPTNDQGESTGEFLVRLRKNMGGPKCEFALRWVPQRMAVENP
jgi:replicative DNA helicase